MEAAIKIEGLREFTKALKTLDGELPKMVRLALNEAAGVVVNYGRARIPRQSGRAAATIRPRSTRTAVRVVEGSNRAPYVPWLDFGGSVGRNRSVQRRFYSEGRYLYPALQDEKEAIRAALESALTRVVEAAGLDLD